MKKLMFFCLMIVSMVVFSESIGTVLVAVDKVMAEQGSKKRTLTRGSPIYTGESIITGSNAHAQIKYTNGTLVSIEANSHYQTVSYAPKSDTVIKSKLNKGSIVYESKNKKQKKGVLETPVVALAVLGTKFQANVTSDNTSLKVTDGTVCVDNLATNTVEQPCLGPNQQLISGVFDRNKKFTPGESSSPNLTHEAVVDINKTVAEVSILNTVNSSTQAIQQLTEVATIVILN